MTTSATPSRSRLERPASPVPHLPRVPQRFATPATLRLFRLAVPSVVAVALVLQLGLAFDTSNLAASALMLLGNGLGYGYALRQSLLRRYPISVLMLLGYTFSYFTVPPLGQLLGAQAITNHLYHPVADVAYALAGLLALLVGHVLYTRLTLLSALRSTLRRRVYKPLGFFRAPRIAQLWWMGATGMVAIVAGRHYNEHASGILQAVMQGLQPFVYMPYITLVMDAWSSPRRPSRLHHAALVPYTGLLLALAFVVNSRAYLLMGFASLAIVYAYLVAVGRLPVPKVRMRTVLLAITLFAVVTGPLARLAMTMVLVRGARADLTPTQLVTATWDTYLSSNTTQRYDRLMAAISGGPGVDEAYFDNLFLNRVANLKFVDNAVINASKLGGSGRAYFRRIEFAKVLALMPQPLIDGLGLPVDKAAVIKGSSGDFLLYAATGDSHVVGGFRTGSLLVNLRLTLAALWPLLLMALSAIVFAFVDALCWTEIDPRTNDARARFNPLVIGMLFSLTFLFTSAATGTDSLSGILGIPLRGWLQLAVLYAIVFWASRLVTSLKR